MNHDRLADETPAGKPPEGKRPGSRTQWVYDDLKEMIRNRRLKSGERIREEEIAQSLGVSRTPVREALARLENSGLVEMSSEGLIVSMLNRSQVIELYAMREVLATAATRFAAERSWPAQAATMRRLARKFEESIGDSEKLRHYDRELHRAIHEASANRYLIRTVEEVELSISLLPVTTFNREGRLEQSVQEHTAIIDAIEKRDPDAAERAVRLHLHNGEKVRLDLMFG